MSPIIKLKRLPHGEGINMPLYTTPGAAGADVEAAVTDAIQIEPGTWELIPSGFSMAVQPGYEVQVRPRSGLALNHGITVLNAPGTIDADYRGELKVILYNASSNPLKVTRGMRIAQIVVAPVSRANFKEVDTLEDDTTRGVSGFGSTGLH